MEDPTRKLNYPLSTIKVAQLVIEFSLVPIDLETKRGFLQALALLPTKMAADKFVEMLPREVTYPINWGDRSRRESAITIDDGYNPDDITNILATFRSSGVKADFFIIGDPLKYWPSLWRQAVSDGHHILNHTQEHKDLGSLSETDAAKQVTGWEQTAAQVLGTDYVSVMKKLFPYFRFPGGRGGQDPRFLRIVEDLGYTPIGGSDETYTPVYKYHDLKKEPPQQVSALAAKHIVDNESNGSIVVLHFNLWDDLALPQIIQGVKAKGLKQKQLDEILTPNSTFFSPRNKFQAI